MAPVPVVGDARVPVWAVRVGSPAWDRGGREPDPCFFDVFRPAIRGLWFVWPPQQSVLFVLEMYRRHLQRSIRPVYTNSIQNSLPQCRL